MTFRYLLGGAIIAAVTLTIGCASTVSGRYVNNTGTSIITLNSDGTGISEVKLRMFGESSSPYDTRNQFLYKLQGNHIHIDMIDPSTGKVYVAGSKAEENWMRPLSDGTLSSDRKTLQIIGDTFARQ